MEKLLFTGASGFLGYNIRSILKDTYDVYTIGLTDENDFKCNLAEEVPLLNTRYDLVLHAAGKAHTVPKTEAERRAFYDINYQGTVNLCKAMENAERYLTEWCAENDVVLGILRPSLIAGHKAPGNLGAMVEGIRKGLYMNIASGKVRKSVLMAVDIARLLPLVEEKGGVYNVCDTYQSTLGELSASVAQQMGRRKPISLPYWTAWCLAKLGDLVGNWFPINSYKLERMTNSLTFSNKKARMELGWEPLDVLENYKI